MSQPLGSVDDDSTVSLSTQRESDGGFEPDLSNSMVT
jgi:hypothetical protein